MVTTIEGNPPDPLQHSTSHLLVMVLINKKGSQTSTLSPKFDKDVSVIDGTVEICVQKSNGCQLIDHDH